MAKSDLQISFENFPANTQIRVGHWPSNNQTNEVFVILHGRTEFIEKYTETAAELLTRGYDVWSMDWRGQGLSAREIENRQKGHIDSFDTYLKDLKWFLTHIIPQHDVKPLVLAHSMGANVVARTLLEQQNNFKGVVLTAPMFDIPMSGINASFAKVLAHIGQLTGFHKKWVPGMQHHASKAKTFKNNTLTSDKERFYQNQNEIEKQPNLAIDRPTIGWLHAAFQSMNALYRLPPTADDCCPVLVCTALADQVVSISAQAEICAKHGWKQIPFHGSKHEILQEADTIRDHFWRAFDNFQSQLF
ncbi:MAG: alpha/beta hydrolase [Pseudomonadota bacterium]|nr:alpha/beta hydrolase [Pseudomonadota bacterium]